VAVRASRAALRRARKDPPLGEVADRADPFAAAEWRDVRRALDDELGRLPEKWRTPLVLSYLEGLPRDDAARQLGWSLRTFHRRLEEARTALRQRLERRGLGASVLAAAVLSWSGLRADVPLALARRCAAIATGRSGVAPHVKALVPRNWSGGLAMKTVLSALALAGGTAVWLIARQPAGADPPREKPGPPVLLAMAPIKTGRPPEDPLAREVRAAQERAIAYLRKTQSAEGHWVQPGGNALMQAGGTALTVLALLDAGLKPGDETVARGLKYLRKIEPKDVYVVSLQTQVFCRANQKEDAERLGRNVKWLEEAAVYDQGRLTGWTYTNAPGRTDNSNSRYAVAALYSAHQAGFKVAKDGFWKEVRDLYVNTQKATGGWGYVPEAPAETHTMTVSGVLCLTLARDVLGKGDEATDLAIQRGFDWIVGQFQLQAQHGAYNLDVVAALGRASDRKTFGDKDRKREWFREGAELLLKNQKEDGRFTLPGALDTMPVVSTAFGLRFLSSRPD
jgi:hypothetical protein